MIKVCEGRTLKIARTAGIVFWFVLLLPAASFAAVPVACPRLGPVGECAVSSVGRDQLRCYPALGSVRQRTDRAQPREFLAPFSAEEGFRTTGCFGSALLEVICK